MEPRPKTPVIAALALALVLAWSAGCSDDGQQTLPDNGPALDVGAGDLGLEASADAQTDLGGHDRAGADQAQDAFQPLAGLGSISGQCGVLDDTEWNASAPFLFRNAINFSSGTWDTTRLSAGGLKVWTEGNLGGSSLKSEVMAHELLYRCELARLLKTEGKIIYQDSGGKKTDLLLDIDARRVGVSVTRAYHYPPTTPYTEAEAKKLLDKKLADLPLSKANASAQDAWTRSVLQVLAYDKQYADAVQGAWTKQVAASVKGSAILMLTVTDGDDSFIY